MDNVNCDSSELLLLECDHNGLFRHNCGHRKDAGARCGDDLIQRLSYINASVIDLSNSVVSVTWMLQNNTVDEPSLFEVECSSERHSTTILESNRTFTTQLGGLLPSTPYNCCVSAVYEVYATTKLCTPVLIIPVTDTMVHLPKHASNSANVVGGVLGFIIIVLIILLAILGTHTIVVYLIKLRRHKREIPSIR